MTTVGRPPVMSRALGAPVRVQFCTPNVAESTVNSTYRPATTKLGPRLSAAIVVARLPPVGLAATVAPPARPLMANPPPSQPAEEAAWAGRFRANVASPRATTPTSARDRRTAGRRVDVLEAIDKHPFE